MSDKANKDKIRLWSRCLHACSWVGLGSMSTQLIRMIRFWILTFLLAPDELGIWILVGCVFGLMQEFSDTGIKHALIQNPRANQYKYLNSAWLMNLIRNILLSMFLYYAAPFISITIYDKPELVNLLRMVCIIFIFDALTSVSLVLLRKQLDFKRVTIVNVIGNLIGLLGTVIFTILHHGVAGVIIGEILCSAAICIMSYIVHPYRPQIKWFHEEAKELIGYGIVAYMVTMIDAFGMRLDVIILGKLADNHDVGIYGLAMTAIMAPCAIFSLLTISVGFPALSIIQHDIATVRRGTAEIIKATQLIALPIFITIFLLAKDIVKVLPDKYAQTSQVLRWLSIFGFFIVSLRQIAPAFYAIKKVHLFIARGIIHIILMAFLIPFLYKRHGLLGACWASNITIILTDIFVFLLAMKELRWTWQQWLQDTAIVMRSVVIGMVSFTLIYFCMEWLQYPWSENMLARMLITVIGLLGYGCGYYRYYRNLFGLSDKMTKNHAIVEK